MKDPVFITARDIPDAWYQALYTLLDHGYLYEVEQGSYTGTRRLEFPFVVIKINHPTQEPFVPEVPPSIGIPPVADMPYIYNYFVDNLMNPDKPRNTDYTYGQRICSNMTKDGSVNQLDLLCTRLKDHPNSNQLVLRITRPTDLTLTDPPCLDFVKCKVIDGELNFHINFRSNDLWNAFVVNMGSLALLMKYIASDVGLKPGSFVYTCSGLHVYESCFDVAAARLYRTSMVR